MFKPGDKVRLYGLISSLHLKLGDIYTVKSDNDSELILVEFPHNDYVSCDFHLVEEKPNTVDEGIIMSSTKTNMTLPTDSAQRKDYPLLGGCVRYFPSALAGVALISKKGNDKHNPGEELHHARNKSMDHGDCILRHLIDVQDLLAKMQRTGNDDKEHILEEVNQLAWRVLAYSQELHENFGAPLAPGAKK